MFTADPSERSLAYRRVTANTEMYYAQFEIIRNIQDKPNALFSALIDALKSLYSSVMAARTFRFPL